MQSNLESGIKRKATFDPEKFPKMAAKIAMWEARLISRGSSTAATVIEGNTGSSGPHVGVS